MDTISKLFCSLCFKKVFFIVLVSYNIIKSFQWKATDYYYHSYYLDQVQGTRGYNNNNIPTKEQELISVSNNQSISQYPSIVHTSDINNHNNDINNHVQQTVLQLRYDYGVQQQQSFSLSNFAQKIFHHQNAMCHLPLTNFRYRNRFGLGSDLHLWSLAICNGIENGYRIRTINDPIWIWYDQESCSSSSSSSTSTTSPSAMTCYFPQSELQCPNDIYLAIQNDNYSINNNSSGNRENHQLLKNITRGRGRIKNECPMLTKQYGIAAIQAAAIEFLFTSLSPLVMKEGQRQLNLLFQSTVPTNLITVHIRWGDKGDEMKLVPIQQYIDAVHTLINERPLLNQMTHSIMTERIKHIYLATEDPIAVQEFKVLAPENWIIYTDVYVQELLPYRQNNNKYNNNPLMSIELNGKPGLIGLGSILVALEANDYVLTTGSNWSRLLNELRTNILDPLCHNCTRMIDLRPE